MVGRPHQRLSGADDVKLKRYQFGAECCRCGQPRCIGLFGEHVLLADQFSLVAHSSLNMAEQRYVLLSQLLEPSPFYRASVLFDRREHWVHPINQQRETFGEFHHLVRDLKEDESRFHSYFRMESETYYRLLDIVGPAIEKHDVGFRRPISSEERFALTLRFLATGMSFRSLSHSFRLGKSTVSEIVHETTSAIWRTLSPVYVQDPTRDIFLRAADMYNSVCNFPNVIGAIDGKHVAIEAPNNSGSMFFNYKHHFSVVLQGIADPQLKFISVEVGAYGKESDGGIFARSKIKKILEENATNLPEGATLPNSDIKLPYYLLGDSAYPLRTYLIPRFSTNSTHETKIFNYRHSRARRCVECAFGVLASKWRVLKTRISTDVTNAENIVLAAVTLHNAVIEHEGCRDIDNDTTPVWDDSQAREVSGVCAGTAKQGRTGRPREHATQIRNQLAQYFVGPGSVSWQEDYI